jgi:uncharacterized membrane protein YraQ (UPF0718 family)/copper chaperone CopZ
MKYRYVLLMIQSFFLEIIRLLGEMAPYLTLGFVLAGLLNAFVPKQTVVRHLGKESVGSAIKAAMIGVPLPLCSCGVVPTGVGLLKRGASRAATVSFLISTPQTGVDSIAVTYGFFGWVFAIFRPVAAFLSGIVGGVASLLVKQDEASENHWLKYHIKDEDALEEANGVLGIGKKLLSGMRFAFIELLGDIAFWLVVGLAVATVISMAVPPNFFSENLPRGWTQMLVMMLFGIPLYVCSTASIPIAAVLMTKGISAGAAFVFLVTGPATNAATMLIIGRVMGWRVLAVYLGSIFLLALGFGIGLDWLTGATGIHVMPMMEHDHRLNPIITWGTAGLLTFFIVLHFMKKLESKLARKKTAEIEGSNMDIKIEGMHCSHCVKTVTQALKNTPGVTFVEVFLDSGSAHVEGNQLNRDTLAYAIEEVGYRVKPEKTPS